MRGGGLVVRVEHETFSESTHAGQITKRPSEEDNDSTSRGKARLGGNERCPVHR